MTVKMADPLVVIYDADCGLCSRTAQALRLLDGRGRLRLVPLQLAPVELGADAPALEAMTAMLHAGAPGAGWSTGGEAALRVARAIPLLRTVAIVGSLPVFRHLVEPAYRLLAANRERIGHLLGTDRCRFSGDAD